MAWGSGLGYPRQPDAVPSGGPRLSPLSAGGGGGSAGEQHTPSLGRRARGVRHRAASTPPRGVRRTPRYPPQASWRRRRHPSPPPRGLSVLETSTPDRRGTHVPAMGRSLRAPVPQDHEKIPTRICRTVFMVLHGPLTPRPGPAIDRVIGTAMH